MKFASITAATLGLLFVTPAIHAFADNQTPPPMNQRDGDRGHDGWDEGKMQRRLGLSDDQIAKLKALRESNKETFKTFGEKEHGLMAKLNDQVVNKASEKDIQTTLAALKENQTAIRNQMEKSQAQKDAILTPTQQAKMVLARHRMMEKHGRPMHDGVMMHRGGKGPGHDQPQDGQGPDDAQGH